MAGWHHQLNGCEFEWTPELVMDREAWRAAIHGVTKSQIWLSDWTELNSFFCAVFRFLEIWSIMSSANSENLLIWIPFIFCHIAVTRTSNNMLNKSESDHPCLVSDLRERAESYSLLGMMRAVWLAFSMVRYIPSIPPDFFFFFYHKWVLKFFQCFFCIYLDDQRIFIFHFVNVMCCVDCSIEVESSFVVV